MKVILYNRYLIIMTINAVINILPEKIKVLEICKFFFKDLSFSSESLNDA